MARQGSVRIIAGKWRRSKLEVPDSPGLRPTPDRVRETLFNWLRSEVEGARCLDLFAGTGALGLEAASRGAREVVLVESDREALRALECNIRRLGAGSVRLHAGDAQAYLASASGAFDIVFLDPPFGQVDVVAVCRQLSERGLLAPWARIYIESDASAKRCPVPEEFQVLRSGRAGRVRYHLASPPAEDAS